MKKINIAIDGPSAAGKSTLARGLAERLGYVHLDTGAMYRCVAYKAYMNSISWDNEQALDEMLANTQIEITPENIVLLDGEDVTKQIRAEDMSMGASHVSKHHSVRQNLVKRQQLIAKDKGYILDGRDIGSVVLKDAEIKIFQTASVEQRALRRYLENLEKGHNCELEKIMEEIAKRDYQDTNRSESPLVKAEGAIELDTSKMSIEEAIDTVLEYVNKCIAEGGN